MDGLRKIGNRNGNSRSSGKSGSYIAIYIIRLDLDLSVPTAGREPYRCAMLLVSLLLVKFKLHETNKSALRLRVYGLNVNQGERTLHPRICIQGKHGGGGSIQVPRYLTNSQ